MSVYHLQILDLGGMPCAPCRSSALESTATPGSRPPRSSNRSQPRLAGSSRMGDCVRHHWDPRSLRSRHRLPGRVRLQPAAPRPDGPEPEVPDLTAGSGPNRVCEGHEDPDRSSRRRRSRHRLPPLEPRAPRLVGARALTPAAANAVDAGMWPPLWHMRASSTATPWNPPAAARRLDRRDRHGSAVRADIPPANESRADPGEMGQRGAGLHPPRRCRVHGPEMGQVRAAPPGTLGGGPARPETRKFPRLLRGADPRSDGNLHPAGRI